MDASQTPTHSGPTTLELPGHFVGPYKLLSLIGEGGFGSVWLAERREPYVQRVALKIIKPGMDSRAVIARFEQERQALAVMDHPNVAKVLDGGLTPLGRPYFVMEHVKGEPITTFCDRHRLTIRQRLELFIPVCEAVQHAHMKGIIHRDLKPTNILVGHVDTTGETPSHGSTSGAIHSGITSALVKVIDFGVAKAVTQTLTDKTIFTEQGQIIGTPEYMSPEQAEMGAVDIDTRTDVYSLGVVLYELLAGVLPFEPAELRCKGHAEIQRTIREADPPRPSTRVTSLGAEAQTVAQARGTRPDELARILKSEVEWLPLMAMRKDRSRRYLTPSDFAADIRRFLRGERLHAGPLSVSYRARTFVRSHRPLVASAAVCLFVLAAAAVHGAVSAHAERAARGRADTAVKDLAGVAAQSFERTADLYDQALTRAISGAPGPIIEGYISKTERIRDLYAGLVDAYLVQTEAFTPAGFIDHLWRANSTREREALQCLISAARVLDALAMLESLPRSVFTDPSYPIPRSSMQRLGLRVPSDSPMNTDAGNELKLGRRKFIDELRPPALDYDQWEAVIVASWGSTAAQTPATPQPAAGSTR